MAEGVPFIGSNKCFAAPAGEEDRVAPLHVFDNGVNIVSCWQLTEEEMKQIARTGLVFLSLWSRGMQPIFVGSEDSVRQITADNGVWRK